MQPYRAQLGRVFQAVHSADDLIAPVGSGLRTDWESVRVAAYHAFAEALVLADAMAAYLGKPDAGYPAAADREPPRPVVKGAAAALRDISSALDAVAAALEKGTPGSVAVSDVPWAAARAAFRRSGSGLLLVVAAALGVPLKATERDYFDTFVRVKSTRWPRGGVPPKAAGG